MASYRDKVSLTRVYPHDEPVKPLPREYGDWVTVIIMLAAWLLAFPLTIGLVEVIKHYR